MKWYEMETKTVKIRLDFPGNSSTDPLGFGTHLNSQPIPVSMMSTGIKSVLRYCIEET